MKKLIILVLALTTSISFGMSEPTTINSVSKIKWTITTNLNSEVSDENFKEAFTQLLKWEGGYANDPNDSGGETYCGISRKSHPNWPGWQTIDNIKPLKWNQKVPELNPQVYSFYKYKYWKGLKFDKINDLRLSNELFDISVNMGKKNAYNFLKLALNELCNDNFDDSNLDSIIEYVNSKDNRFLESLTKLINGYQLNRYLDIVKRYPNKRRYLKVWLLRC